jgi:RimJ/RimL family protein N-acetyltransferase
VTKILLRNVTLSDLDILFEQQLDHEAVAMSEYPSKDRGEFFRHWEGIMKNKNAFARVILYKGKVAGHILCWKEKYEYQVGYWIGKEFWGRGVATSSLSAILLEIKTRPLFAHTASHNHASRRVLEKCGFILLDESAKATTFKLS